MPTTFLNRRHASAEFCSCRKHTLQKPYYEMVHCMRRYCFLRQRTSVVAPLNYDIICFAQGRNFSTLFFFFTAQAPLWCCSNCTHYEIWKQYIADVRGITGWTNTRWAYVLIPRILRPRFRLRYESNKVKRCYKPFVSITLPIPP